MNKKKIENLLKYSEFERADYFMRYCADFEKVWGLVDEKNDWITLTDFENDHIFPLWPENDLAEYCCFEEFKKIKAQPKSINLDVFLTKCIPDMARKNIIFGIFFDDKRKGLTMSGDKLSCLLKNKTEIIDT